MPRSEEAEHWFNAVYAAVQQIPRGKVTCYSHIAFLLDERESPISRSIRYWLFDDQADCS